ncbi:MAG: hypothetical protein IJP92_04200, partial [Lachnospiraceae bacterium]|nr:hypothetical protein [Lachnospiraceae bacterium]
MVKRVACFFTCGYTESGAMQQFMRKMNTDCEFVQVLPNKARKKRDGDVWIKSEWEGLSGSGLHSKVYEILRKYRTHYCDYDAVLIEDDLDGRFNGKEPSEIDEINKNIVDQVRSSVGRQDMKVVLLYAAPEVEGWFLADWNNSFASVYTDKAFIRDIPDVATLKHYVHNLYVHIRDNIIDPDDDIEAYGQRG